MTWHPAAEIEELADRPVIGREVEGRRLALYRLEGEYFATAGTCTHGSAPLSDGEVVEGYIECPLHFGLFEIRTGKAAGGPVGRDLRTYPVRLEGTRIEVDLPDREPDPGGRRRKGPGMKLYGYWRSTSSYRVRIALALKGLSPDAVPVHLVRDGGEQLKPAYRALNPQGRVPSLALDDGTVLVQSPAIIEFLEETHPEPPLLPSDPVSRAQVRGVAALIGCDVHPLHNSGPLNYLRRELGRSDPEVSGWIARWIGDGLAAVEALIPGGPFCFGPAPDLADLYLVPQLYAARRFSVPLASYPKVLRAEAAAAEHPAFAAAHPSRQPDAE